MASKFRKPAARPTQAALAAKRAAKVAALPKPAKPVAATLPAIDHEAAAFISEAKSEAVVFLAEFLPETTKVKKPAPAAPVAQSTPLTAAQLVAAMTSAIDSRLAGKSAATAKALFVGYNTVTPVTERNAGAWPADITGITAISPWNEYTTNTRAGTLLSRDVMVNANHYLPHLTNGTVVHFVTLDGTLVTRTIIGQMQVGSTDIYLSRLSSDLPDSIAHCKVLPAAIYTEVAALVNSGTRIPVLQIDQQESALVGDWTSESAGSSGFSYPIDAKRLEFSKELVQGDSGNIASAIYESDLIAITVFTGGGPGAGSSIHQNRAAINAAMTTLGSAYQLTEISL